MRWALVFLFACRKQQPPPAPAPDDASLQPIADASSEPAPIDAGPSGMSGEDWEIVAGKWTFDDGEASCECTSGSAMYWKRSRPKDFDASIEVFFLTTESSAGLVFREAGGTFYQFEQYTRGTHHDRRLSLMVKNPYWVQ